MQSDWSVTFFGQNIKRRILSEIEFAMGSQESSISHCFQEKEMRKFLKMKKKGKYLISERFVPKFGLK